MSLLDLQRDFIGYLLDKPSDMPVHASGDAGPGLCVYHNAYRGQLIACLKDTYERLWAWLGDDAFEAAARSHIAGNVPESWTLGDYGIGFADTLGEIYPEDPEVAEIATLDWALRRAFDGPDCVPFDPARLTEVDWEEALIHFVPTLTLLPVTTNSGAIWNAIAGGEEVPPAETLPGPAWIRVWRVGLQPHFATIEADEHRAIEYALSGMSFARMCDRLASTSDVAGAVDVAGQCLGTWLQEQVIADIR